MLYEWWLFKKSGVRKSLGVRKRCFQKLLRVSEVFILKIYESWPFLLSWERMANESVFSKADRSSSTSGAKGSVKSCSSFYVLPLPGGRFYADLRCCWVISLFLSLLNQCMSKTSSCSNRGGRQLGKGHVHLEMLLLVSNFGEEMPCLRGMVNRPPQVPSSSFVPDGFHSQTRGSTNTERGSKVSLTNPWLA